MHGQLAQLNFVALNYFFTAFPLIIGGIFVGFALYYAVRSLWRLRGSRKFFGLVGGILVAYGGVAWFGIAFSAFGGLPATFEWPVGRADQLIPLSDGHRIAIHPASAHIQLYDRDWKFLYGWIVPAGGGDFKARLNSDNTLDVWTARGQAHLVFSVEGKELERSTYSEDYMKLPVASGPGSVPTPIPLLVFANPFIAWAVCLVGLLMLRFSDPQRFGRKKMTQPIGPSKPGSALSALVGAVFVVIGVGVTIHMFSLNAPWFVKVFAAFWTLAAAGICIYHARKFFSLNAVIGAILRRSKRN